MIQTRKYQKSALVFAIISLLCSSSNATYDLERVIDEKTRISIPGKLNTYLENANAYGFSGQVLVAQKGKVLLNQSYGFANREDGKLITRNTAFNIASLTKPFTAITILHLEQNNQLKTSDSIDKFFKNVPADKEKITIHQLLSHQSGLSRNFNGKEETRDGVVQEIFKQPLASKVGEQFRYSNNGYHLLAAIIEIAGKKTYSDYLTENVLKPAKMKQTGFYQDNKWSEKNIAQGYNEWTKVKPFTDWKKTWNYGSGSIVSNTSDLFKWYAALKDHRILSQDIQRKLITKHAETNDKEISYGYGWYLTKTKTGDSLFYHGGDNYGYHSEFRWFPKDDILIIVLTNNEAFSYIDGGAVQKRIIADNLYRIVKEEKYQSPPPLDKKVSRDLSKYVGTYSFPDGSRFVIGKNAGFLNISAEGQNAINYLAGYDSEAAQKYLEATMLTSEIIGHITAGENEKIRELLSAKDYDFYIKFLAEDFSSFKAEFGEYKDYKIQGTAALPWNINEYRTNVILNFENGKTDLYLGWQDRKLFDVTTETGRPFPLILPLVPQSATDFSTYEFIRGQSVSIKFTTIGHEATELSIKTVDGVSVARKVNDAR